VFADRALVFADCAVNVDPTPEALADIALASAESCRACCARSRASRCCRFRRRAAPRTRTSTRSLAPSQSPQPRAAARHRRRAAGGCGARRIGRIAQAQGHRHVAGRANVLVFPDLDAGNIAYKLCNSWAAPRRSARSCRASRGRSSDLSRGASVDDIVATSAILLAQCVRADQRTSMGT
jgi:phosphate acetyltransferase